MPPRDREFEAAYASYQAERLAATRVEALHVLARWKERRDWGTVGGVVQQQPIRRYYDRIKRAESLRDKLHKSQQIDPNASFFDQFGQVFDFLGARVVVYVNSDIPLIDKEIRESGEFELNDSKRPKSFFDAEVMEEMGLDPSGFDINRRKVSGYSSVHYILRPVNAPSWMELQVRTMLVDAWSDLEHDLVYKSDFLNEASLTKHFRLLSDHLRAVDTHFDLIVDRVRFLQNTHAAPRTNEHLTSLTFPAVCHQLGLPMTSSEGAKALRILSDYDFETVEDLQSRLSPNVLSALKRERARAGGPELTALEAVSVAVLLSREPSPDEAVSALAEQLKLVELSKTRLRK